MNIFGSKIKIEIFGASHAECIGVKIFGLPSGFRLDTDRVQRFLDRRAPGRDAFSTTRREGDKAVYTEGISEGVTTGETLTAVIYNNNQHSKDYDELRKKLRPSHADYPAMVKYGENIDLRGGGKFSGRMTAPLCIAGAILMQMLEQKGIYIGAHISSIANVKDEGFDTLSFDVSSLQRAQSKTFPVLSDEKGEQMKRIILEAKENLDSVGGTVECMITGVPTGTGDHMFMGLENVISSCVFGIPAVKGIEFGLGFGSTELLGSENNDSYYYDEGGNIRTYTNNCGGILGGMANGMPISFKVAIKPTPSIGKTQNTVNIETNKNDTLEIKGRHDPCIVQRAVPCVEAAAAVAIAQLVL